MTKKTIAFIVVVSICLLTVVGSHIKDTYILPYGKVDVSGNIVNNDYNNCLAGGYLVRLDDKLYYNYVKSGRCYGLIEISETGSKRVFWKGIKMDAYKLTHFIRKENSELLMMLDDKVNRYIPETQTFEYSDTYKDIPCSNLDFQRSGDGIYYLSYFENPYASGASAAYYDKKYIAYYDEKGEEVVVNKEVDAFNIVGDNIFYLVRERKDGKQISRLNKYNIAEKTDTVICETSELYFYTEFLIEDNHIVFKAFNQETREEGVYKINVVHENAQIETVCTENKQKDSDYNIYLFNVFDKKIYVASNYGVECYDLSTNKGSQLCTKYARECYILDDKWVYFIGDENVLWRVAQDGSVTEKVYG